MNAPDTSVDIYERLVAALEALPHGFGRTESGVELKLMRKAFTEEEVWLAGQLARFPERHMTSRSRSAVIGRAGRRACSIA